MMKNRALLLVMVWLTTASLEGFTLTNSTPYTLDMTLEFENGEITRRVVRSKKTVTLPEEHMISSIAALYTTSNGELSHAWVAAYDTHDQVQVPLSQMRKDLVVASSPHQRLTLLVS